MTGASRRGWRGRRARALAAPAQAVPRLLVFCDRPQHLSPADAEAWISAQVAELLRCGMVQRARLTPLANASSRWSRPWDWMLELDVRADRAQEPALGSLARWLGDLRLLGMRPVVMAAADGRLITTSPSRDEQLMDRAEGRRTGALTCREGV